MLVAAVALWLGIQAGEIVCYDESDRPQGDYRALAAALAAANEARAEAERRAAAESAARAEAETRLRALEAELRRRRDH